MGQTDPFCQLCVIFTKKQHGARPCMEKMQFIFFVPPDEKTCGHAGNKLHSMKMMMMSALY